MIGGSGDDVFYVDDPEDVVNEEAGGGNDTIYTTIAGYTAANVENIIYVVASDPLCPAPGNPFRGTDGPNHINGDSGDNVIDGLGGNRRPERRRRQRLHLWRFGQRSARRRQGSDTLNGGSGNDTMYGGTGNDWYYVNSSRDKIVEGAGGGKDLVLASFSYSIAANPFLEDVVSPGDREPEGDGQRWLQSPGGQFRPQPAGRRRRQRHPRRRCPAPTRCRVGRATIAISR